MGRCSQQVCYANRPGPAFPYSVGQSLDGAELLQGCNRASVEFAPGFSHVEDYYRGKSINRIDRATIQHITLCRHAAYPQTAVWPEGDFKLDNHTAVARDRFYASEACLAS